MLSDASSPNHAGFVDKQATKVSKRVTNDGTYRQVLLKGGPLRHPKLLRLKRAINAIKVSDKIIQHLHSM